MSANITIIGNLAADPELKFTPSGKANCSFVVISSKSRKVGETWESTDVTSWTCDAWEYLAENVANSLQKGDSVVVHGSVYQDSWEDKQTGQKRSKMKVRASNVGIDLKRAPAVTHRDHKNSTPKQVVRETGYSQDYTEEWKSPLNPDKDFPF